MINVLHYIYYTLN